ncbi:MAG: D-alanyl-D-alanine carboxypeptidase family protein [Magnetococcales bacterium]|nr:D-alanyl-D-alanine carboxypeptidase family protein [Magnetococcales bacterium]
MKRRDFIKAIGLGVAGNCLTTPAFAGYSRRPPVIAPKPRNEQVSTYLRKMREFDRDHSTDVFLSQKKFRILTSTKRRLEKIQSTIGHANFHLLDFDDALKAANRFSDVGSFLPEELDLLEMVFYESATEYGFYGEKPIKNLTDRIPKREVVKIPGSGNFLYKGLPLRTYYSVKKELGDKIVLTSGVRGVSKQFMLFLRKTYESGGNLSRASRSLAPPGYSFHGISDFDVGQKGFGAANFTSRFITTDVYKRLVELGYLQLRYPRDNLLGVRFEPWHIKVNT